MATQPQPYPSTQKPCFLVPMALPLQRPATPSSCTVPSLLPHQLQAQTTHLSPLPVLCRAAGSPVPAVTRVWGGAAVGTVWARLCLPLWHFLCNSEKERCAKGVSRQIMGQVLESRIPAASAPYFLGRYLSLSDEFILGKILVFSPSLPPNFILPPKFCKPRDGWV